MNDRFTINPATPSISFVCTSTSDNMLSAPRLSPPKALVDSSPLQPAMNKNKESLKVKLMVRRSVNQLVEQGIMPPLKTSPAIHEQRKQLERAKTGDLLKAKIQQRPDRHELERLHILEQQEGNIDPSLAEKRRMLEKARLADQLNSKISHRPGPLELIEKNILHTEEPIERIVKEGLVTFKSTNEATNSRPQIPDSYVFLDDDTQQKSHVDAYNSAIGQPTTSSSIPSPTNIIILQTKYQSNVIPAYVSETSSPPPPPPPPPPPQKQDVFQQKSTQKLFAELCQTTVSGTPSSPLQSNNVIINDSNSGAWSPISSISSPPSLTMISKPSSNISTSSLLTPLQNNQKSDAPGKEKNRKKNKNKPVAKSRAIKFHEYKGPPSAQKSNNHNQLANGETNYQLIMKQQYLLEYLEEMYKHPHILPANQKPSSCISTMNLSTDVKMTTASPMPKSLDDTSLISASPIPPSPASSVYSETTSVNTSSNDLGKLNRMKVSDLKQQCKRFNLPVSGPKPQLIERLKPYLEIITSDGIGNQSISNEEQSICGDTCDIEFMNSPIYSLSPESDFDNLERNDNIENDLAVVREQQRQIAELQRKLRQSQEELEHIRQKSNTQTISKQESVNLKLKQQLTARLQNSKIQNSEGVTNGHGHKESVLGKQNQNKGSVFPTQLNSTPRDNMNNSNNKVVTFYDQKTLIPTLYVLSATPLPANENFEKPLNNTKNIVVPFSTTLHNSSNGDQKPTGIVVPLPIINNHNISSTDNNNIDESKITKATKCDSPVHCGNDLKKSEKEENVVSQDMTDVLEILLKNGELPDNLRRDNSTHNNRDNSSNNVTTDMIVDHHSTELSNNILLNENHHHHHTEDILNYNVLSPMNNQDLMTNDDLHGDETLDKLLGQAQKLLPDLNHSFHNGMNNDNISNNNNDHNNSMHNYNNTPIDSSTLMTDFTDIELMEFQMDIDEDSCHNNLHLNRNNSIVNNGNTNNFSNFSNCNGVINTNNSAGNMSKSNNINNSNSFINRELNTTLQPSLSELMRQQNTNPYRYNNYNINNFINSNNQHFHIDTMDFESLLSTFDIPSSSLMLTNSSMCNENNLAGTLNQNSDFQTQDNILDLFNDDYRMQNENLTCEVDNLLC